MRDAPGGVDKQSYAEELKLQMMEKRRRDNAAAEERRRLEEKEELATQDYDPWGKAGAAGQQRVDPGAAP